MSPRFLFGLNNEATAQDGDEEKLRHKKWTKRPNHDHSARKVQPSGH